ncbi:hypothetical protein BHF71_09945 [Vulcanibacillus modesticaldus]|uniref:N-acetyltransferase domain-containing protein n=1 Tax=Vulcanibacillus modesticaldus TaxID=337097 RepID=A0A1D2YTL8_9BACI|nr:GNAT family N-acetyltransferase [Vulcanibacillus modesticaldus]OEF99001.1 hypothetical protein BHF71_09945 [Vulcanibacillus modesticaldus]
MIEEEFYKLFKGKKVYIRRPKYDGISYINKLWSDEETTSELGGPFSLTEEKAKTWYPKMVNPTDGKNFYCLIFNYNNEPVGEVSFHRYNSKTKTAELNIKIEGKHRGNGYSKEALQLILNYFFFEFGGEIMIDPVLLENKRGQQLLLNFGFERDESEKDIFLLRMSKERFIKLINGI